MSRYKGTQFLTVSVCALGLQVNIPAIAQEAEEVKVLEVQNVSVARPDIDPGSISRVPQSVLNQIGRDHPAEVLNTLPGVNIQMNSGQEHLIALRSPVLTAGAGQGSFLIQLDGVPTRAAAFGNVNALFELPYEGASNLEVVRGPGGARHGSNAVHGVINVLSKAPENVEPYIQLSAGSLARARIDGALSGEQEDIAWSGFASLQHDDGWRDDSGLDQQKIAFKVSNKGKVWNLDAGVFGSNLHQETAGFIQGDNVYEDQDITETNPNPEAFRDAWTARVQAKASRDVGENGELNFVPFAITQHMIFRQHFLPYKGIEKNGHDSVGLLSRYNNKGKNIDWTLGIDAQWASGYLKEIQPEPFGFFPSDTRFPVGIHYDYEVDTLTFAGFAEARVQATENLLILAGVRAETHRYEYATNTPAGINGRFQVPSDRDDNFDLLTPKFGLVWTGVDDTEIYANFSRGERAPQASDLYRLQSLQNVAEADVESNDSVEIGIRGRLAGYINYDIAAYSMQKSDFFFRDANRLNVADGKTDHNGIEIALASANNLGFVWSGQVSYGDHTYEFDRAVNNVSEVISNGNQIDTSPEWLADLGAGYIWNTGAVRWDLEYVGEYFTNAANSRTYPGHTIHHIRLDQEISDNVKGFVVIRNVFDERYADRADFAFGNDRYFPGEPANLMLGLRFGY